MKKYFVVAGVAMTVLVFSNCSSSKKVTAVPKSTYTANVTAVIMNSCAPCHIPAKGGNKRSYDNFANVKADIDEIIRRVQLNPTDRGFMPFKKTAKISDADIAVFKQWKADGMLEK